MNTTARTLHDIQPIRPYTGPQWLVEPWYTLSPEDTTEEMAAIEEVGWTVIDTIIMGWGEHNAIIRTSNGTDYLATLHD